MGSGSKALGSVWWHPVLSVLAGVWLAVSCAAGSDSRTPDRAKQSTPRNVVIMISDGCGFNQIEATDIYQFGREVHIDSAYRYHGAKQLYERFPVAQAMSTYSLDGGGYPPAQAWSDFKYLLTNPTDSAAAATAMASGVKTHNAAIGVDALGQPVRNVIEQAEALGKSTGVVTTVELSDGTPAGFVAHNRSREAHEEIAHEMILSSGADVIMGCGHPWFDNDGRPRLFPKSFKYVGGASTWHALVAGTAGSTVDADHNGVLDDAWTLVQTRKEFQALMNGPTPKRVCGVARVYKTLQVERGGDGKAPPFRAPRTESVPTLEEMTRAALNVLDDDPDGLLLMVEGGAIDHACHYNEAGRMIEEEMDFNRAVEAVTTWIEQHGGWEETLLIVTADHETGGLTGPGSDPRWMPLVNRGKGIVPGLEWHTVGHTNSLVPFFAKGAGAESFRRRAAHVDPRRGAYMDNTDLAAVLFDLIGRAAVSKVPQAANSR